MKNIKRENIVFSLSDEVYLQPEKAFKKEKLENLFPYQIFTGVGAVATFENNRFKKTRRYFENRNAVNRFAKKYCSIDLVQVDECFYAYVVHQNMERKSLEINKV